ncbi:MAG: carboxypeptidase-like regulatory domain-containing protein [Myxococcales bacterium]
MLAPRMLRVLLAFCLGLWATLVPCLALAQGQPADRALANDLFQRGRKALLEQRYAEACPLLEESQRLDPAGGTLLNLALCHENLGQTATAWTEYHDALAIARHERRSDRAEFALAHIASLEARLSRLVIEAELPLAEGLVIERDGTVLNASVWGEPMPVDPGVHSVRARAPGYVTFEQSVTMADAGDTQTVRVPVLALVPPPEPPPAPPVVALPEPPAEIPEEPSVQLPPEPKPAPAPPPPAWKRRLAWSMFAVSLASAITATVTGVRAIRLRNEAESRCKDGFCTNSAFALDDKSTKHAHASTALSAVSVATAGAGLVLWFVRGQAPQEPAQGHVTGLGLSITRAF